MKSIKNYFFAIFLFLSGSLLGQTWSSIGGTKGANIQVNAMAVYNGELYIGGEFDHAGGIPAHYIAKWNGTVWDTVGTGLFGGYGVYCMIVYAGELYVGGDFYTAGGVSSYGLARWNGSTWNTVGTPIGLIYALVIHNGALYAGGQFSGTYNNIAKWNGTTWSALGSGVSSQVQSLASYNHKLYAGGDEIYSWNDTVWHMDYNGVIRGLPAYPGVNVLFPYNGELYAGGDIGQTNYHGGVGVESIGIAKQDDTTSWWNANWYPVGSGTTNLDNLYTLGTYNGELYAGGHFYSSSGSLVSKWNGTSWSALGAGITGFGSAYSVNSICEYKGELYVGGEFGMTTSGGDTTINIAKWHESTGSTNVCYGQCNGTASVNPIGGIAPYSFLWDPSTGSQTTAMAAGLCAGTYTVNVTDSAGTITSYSATISQPLAPLSGLAASPAICDSGCVTLSATAAGGTSPYLYYWGPYSYSTSPVVCTGSSTTYNCIIKDAAGCVQTTISTIVIHPSPLPPSASLFGPIAFCPGDSSLLKSTSVSGTSLQWLKNNSIISGATDTLYNPLSAGLYSVMATTIFGCSDTSSAINVYQFLDCDTWPGDADNNGLADNADLLPIGIYYGQTGLTRAGGISNVWQAWPSTDWGIAQPSGQDVKQADCNGDGIIDNNDTLAVNLNFSSVHAFAPLLNNSRSTNPDLYFQTSASSYLPGDWVNVDVMIGTATLPVTNLYGIAFNINYDASLVQSGTESLTYPASWFATPGTNAIKISKVASLSNTVYGAETRINHTNADGFGKIATFRFQTGTSITSSSTMNFSISYYTANDSIGDSLFFNPVPFSVPLVISGINEITNSNSISIYPNPYSGQTTILYSLKEKSDVNIEVYTSLGEKVQTIVSNSQAAGDYKYTFSAKEKGFDAGIYFVKITIDGKISMRRIVEMQ